VCVCVCVCVVCACGVCGECIGPVLAPSSRGRTDGEEEKATTSARIVAQWQAVEIWMGCQNHPVRQYNI